VRTVQLQSKSGAHGVLRLPILNTLNIGISLEPGAWNLDVSSCRSFNQFDRKRNARLRFVVEPHVHGIQTRFREFQLLDVHDEIAGDEMHVVRQRHFNRDFDAGHDGTSVGVDEVKLELARALVAGEKRDAQRDRALRMHGGQLWREDRVERAEQVQFAVVLGRRVAEHRHLNVHGEIKTGIPENGTNFFQ
jgi:hypothetical protein